MPTLKTTYDQSGSSGIAGYTNSEGHLINAETDAICMAYAGGNSNLALEIKYVAGEFIKQNPLVTDLREAGEVAHPSLQHNIIILQTLGMVLSNRIFNPFDPASLAILKKELLSQLDSGADRDLTNPGYCDENGHLLDQGVAEICLSYTQNDPKVAELLQLLVGNYIKTHPAITDDRQYLDSYTTRQRIGIMTLSKIGMALKNTYDQAPEKIEEILNTPTTREILQRNIFNLLALAQKEEGHLGRYDQIKLNTTSNLIDRLFSEGISEDFALEIEHTKQKDYGKHNTVPKPETVAFNA